MARKVLQAAGVLALLLFVGGGILAWSLVKQRVQVTIQDGERGAGDEQTALLRDEVRELGKDLRALRDGLAKSLVNLAESQAGDAELRAAAATKERVADREVTVRLLAELEARLSARLDAFGRDARAPGLVAPPPVAVPAERQDPVEPVASAPNPTKPRKAGSFLAFDLPGSTVRFDAPARWVVVPALSRVGFDAKSTLHDFTGVTTKVSGEVRTNLAAPERGSEGSIRAAAGSLDTGLPDRNTAMYEHLDTTKFPDLGFVLEGFTASTSDPATEKVSGTAQGTLTIRGKARPFTMPITARIDDARRLCLDGEQKLKLSEFEVPLPSKLGLIKMEDEVKVWIALRLRAEGGAK